MEDEDISHHYDNSHRAFLQAFMARGTMTFNQAQPILAAIFTAHDENEHKKGNSDEEPEVTRPEQVTREDFESYVSAVSAAISPFDMEIRSITHQVSKERVYSLINMTSDPMTQLATLRSAEEMAFVRRVIDAMFDRYNSPRMEVLCLDGMQANKLRTAPRNEDGENGNDAGENGSQAVGSLKGLKSSEVEQVLRGLVDEGWFERSRAGFYSLSARALTELRQWLVDAYNDPEAGDGEWQRVKFCEACREIVTVGQRCAERDCCIRLHDICQEAFWRTRKERVCPRCSTGWTGKNFVGERAVTETEAYQRGRRRSGRGGGRSSLVEDIMDGGEDEDEDEE
ncbi:Nse1 non-SMC component of SMC5-6 complex-domain-containing protein [Daldinia loculata]|nr:Nse1 non-SMC component of SMC5-6 complex-domain-containing protein [Daldinia loculata]